MSKAQLKNEAVGRAFRRLADEHFAPDAKRDEATWKKIQDRSLGGASGLHSLRYVEKPGRRWLAWGAAVAVAAAAVFSLTLTLDNEPAAFSYTVDEISRVKGAPGLSDVPGELVAAEEREVRVTFSDETRATLAPHSTIRLTVNDAPARVQARLARGQVSFEAGAEPAAEVQLLAGTFRLKAMGASFVFSYVPGEGKAQLATKRGEVEVIDAAGVSRRVAANQSITLVDASAEPDSRMASDSSAGRGASKPSVDLEAMTLGSEQTTAAGSETKPREKVDIDAQHEVARTSKQSLSPSFAQLAAAGRFTEVVESAHAQGVSQVLATASAGELQELAQAARYSGNLSLAARVWTQMTSRFSGETAGKNARFFLGRLAEQQGNTASALANYDRYLSAAGAGVYTAEALGRKLNLVHKSQGTQHAQSVAREYLRLFPSGPYARLAREVSSSPAQAEAD